MIALQTSPELADGFIYNPDFISLGEEQSLVRAIEELEFADFKRDAAETAANWDRLMQVRDSVLKILETARNEKLIGAPLEARVRLSANGDLYPLLEQYASQLPGLFIVSQVDLERAAKDDLGVKVERATGQKCERCWKYTSDVGSDPKFPTICGSCAGAVNEILNG